MSILGKPHGKQTMCSFCAFMRIFSCMCGQHTPTTTTRNSWTTLVALHIKFSRRKWIEKGCLIFYAVLLQGENHYEYGWLVLYSTD